MQSFRWDKYWREGEILLFVYSLILEKRGQVLNELEIIISQTVVTCIPEGKNPCVWYKLMVCFQQTEWLRRILRQSEKMNWKVYNSPLKEQIVQYY